MKEPKWNSTSRAGPGLGLQCVAVFFSSFYFFCASTAVLQPSLDSWEQCRATTDWWWSIGASSRIGFPPCDLQCPYDRLGSGPSTVSDSPRMNITYNIWVNECMSIGFSFFLRSFVNFQWELCVSAASWGSAWGPRGRDSQRSRRPNWLPSRRKRNCNRKVYFILSAVCVSKCFKLIKISPNGTGNRNMDGRYCYLIELRYWMWDNWFVATIGIAIFHVWLNWIGVVARRNVSSYA